MVTHGRRTLYALSHKSSSTQSALVDFSTAVDLDDAPPTDEERAYLETEFLKASAASPPRLSSSVLKSKKSTYVPTEILMDESTIQVIQCKESLDDSMDDEARELMSLANSTCPEHAVHLPFMCSSNQTFPTQTIQASYSAYSHHSPPLICPIPIRPLPRQGSVPFDSVSFHVQSHTSRKPELLQSHSQDYVSSTKSSPTPKGRLSSRISPIAGLLRTSPLPGLFRTSPLPGLFRTSPLTGLYATPKSNTNKTSLQDTNIPATSFRRPEEGETISSGRRISLFSDSSNFS
jgi:hypothetical protein